MSSATGRTLKTLWSHRALWWQFTKRQVELRHKGSHLGLLWSLLTPLLLLSLYVLVFGFIFGGRFRADASPESRIEYALIVFLGLAIHHFVAEVMTLGPTLVLSNPNFVKKVVFPLEILPAAAVGAAAIHFLITLALVFTGALVTGVSFSLHLLWLPVLLLPLLFACLGISLGLAALGVFWRDIAQVTQFLVLALLFASAVFYPVSQIPGGVWYFLRFNPLIHFIEEARAVTFWQREPNVMHVTYVYCAGGALLALGSAAFQRLRAAFADVL
jgi:lipopolysaccharide transport system permease protein